MACHGSSQQCEFILALEAAARHSRITRLRGSTRCATLIGKNRGGFVASGACIDVIIVFFHSKIGKMSRHHNVTSTRMSGDAG